MKIYLTLITICLLLAACGTDDSAMPSATTGSDDNEIGAPEVQLDATYNVLEEENIVYAQGLSHESVNSPGAIVMSLMLDAYVPENDSDNRPAFIFIHGGGFTGGDKKGNNATVLADYYASRGWVFFSINYRLAGDMGTVPQEWLDISENLDEEFENQFLAIYPAHRDAKAALRWIVANSDKYNINTDYITVGGGSAGAITAITLGVSDQEDYRDELDTSNDPTLVSTNLEQTYEIQTIVDFWGSKIAVDALEETYGHQRFDPNDPPMFIAHGTEDPTVLFSSAVELKAIYDANGIPTAYYPLEGLGHGVWNATVDGKRLEELAFDFLVEQQDLIIN